MSVDETAPCPPHLSGAEAAALPLTGLTGWRALVTKSGLIESHQDRPYSGYGKNLLITGIGGGVALMVLLFAVKMGVRVWVTTSDAGKLAKARELGAEGGVNYKEKGWEKALKGMLPKDRPYLDAIIDGAGGDIVLKGGRLLKVSQWADFLCIHLKFRISLPSLPINMPSRKHYVFPISHPTLLKASNH